MSYSILFYEMSCRPWKLISLGYIDGVNLSDNDN